MSEKIYVVLTFVSTFIRPYLMLWGLIPRGRVGGNRTIHFIIELIDQFLLFVCQSLKVKHFLQNWFHTTPHGNSISCYKPYQMIC